jgi:4-amino-4-deoxy-L-arabinose transferase-like glycosyltransferase
MSVSVLSLRRSDEVGRWGLSRRAVALIPLVLILVLQSVVSLTVHNSAFQDEALYVYAGREYFENMFMGGGEVIEPYELYFSGWPRLYPLIAGGLDVVGGIEAARMFSLLAMLLATACVFSVTERVYNYNAAVFAAALFSVQGSVLFLSRLATYDAMCLALAAAATVLALTASKSRGVGYTILTGLALFMAVASKYAGLMFVPTVIALLFWATLTTLGWKQAVLKVVVTTGIVVGAIAAVLLIDQDVLVGVQATTTARQALLQTPRLDLAERSIQYGGGLALLALFGLVSSRLSWKLFPLSLIFFGTVFIAPVYHIYKMESFSMHKHIAYGAFFAAPLAGLAVSKLSAYEWPSRVGKWWFVGLAVCVLSFGIGFLQFRGFYAEWANSDELIRIMRTQVRSGTGRYLAEESEVMRYYLHDAVEGWQWNQLYWFFYTDRDGVQREGVPAYRAAIDDAYFDLIVLRYGPAVTTAQAIDDNLYDGDNYELIAQIPYFTMFGDGYYWVWRRRDSVQFMGREQFADT